MDPATDNEMKRIHKPNHPNCIPFTSSAFECPKCERKFKSPENLDVHMNSEQEEEFHSSFTMLSGGSFSDALLSRCEICMNDYENPRDLEDHAKIIHNSEFVDKDSFHIYNAEFFDKNRIISDRVDAVRQEMISISKKENKNQL